MSLLLGISRDEEIAKVQVATEEEFEDFEHGLLDITLDPMRPYFGSPRPTAWNSGLCDLFLDHFETENDLTLGEEQKLEIEDMFDNRIQTLRRKWREAQNKNEEELKEQKQKSGKLSRANAQRCRVSCVLACRFSVFLNLQNRRRGTIEDRYVSINSRTRRTRRHTQGGRRHSRS